MMASEIISFSPWTCFEIWNIPIQNANGIVAPGSMLAYNRAAGTIVIDQFTGLTKLEVTESPCTGLTFSATCTLFCAANTSTVQAISLSTQLPLWKFALGTHNAKLVDIVVSNASVVVAATTVAGVEVLSLDAGTGLAEWTTTFPGTGAALAVDGDGAVVAVVMNGSASYLYVLGE